MVRDIGKWLEELKLGQYATAFAENDVDEDLLFELNEEDLVKLGVTSLGHRKRLVKEIKALRPDGRDRDQPRGDEPATRPLGAEAERRQLTVMFCDLVGSTELSGRLDPEDLREVLRQYQNAVTTAVTHYGGHVGQYLGDGVLVYFGWPQAHEDQAERAILAGLDAIAKVRAIALDGDTRLNARVGIASGPVVIGEFVDHAGQDVNAVTGRTPNLAARLQSLAGPGQVAIDEHTRDLIGSSFRLEDLGHHDLKGFNRPVPLWLVAGKGQAKSRFEAAHRGRLSRLIGREHELNLVRARWARARHADGQIALLTGEAGIGKSRTAKAFCEALSTERHLRVNFQCSPLHTNSALHPIIQSLERAAGFSADDDEAARLDKLERLLRLSPKPIDSVAPFIAALLSLPGEQRYGPLNLPPQQIRDRTIEVLIDWLVDLSRRRPILLLLEDAHWIDPTTETLIGRAIQEVAGQSIFMLITLRPDYTPPWSAPLHLVKIDLDRLPWEQGVELVRASGGEDLADSVVNEIVTRAEGVPLFVEELTYSLLQSDDNDAELPASIQASLVARLDRLRDAAKVAQLAAMLGRTFHYRFIRAVSDLRTADLDQALVAMTDSGLLSQHGTPPQATYEFRHALIQDAAYETLLKSRRAEFHGRVAEVLLRDFSDQAATAPEIVARHLSLAGQPERAVEFWLRAGQRARERSALVEAIVHLEKGLGDLSLLPRSRSADESEFDLRIALGASLAALKGWSSPEVEENYERAHDISTATGEMQKSFIALRGLFNVFALRGKIEKARAFADNVLAIAVEKNDPAMLLDGYRLVGMCSFFVGEFEVAREKVRRANAIYDRSAHRSRKFLTSTDPAVIGLSIVAWINWFLGDIERARIDVEAALALAEELQHPFSLAYARSLVASVHQVGRDAEAVLEQAEAAIVIAEEYDYPYWQGWSTVMQGWALSALGREGEGIKVLKRGLEIYESTGARQVKPYILTLLAEMHGWAGTPLEGIDALKGAYGPGNETDVRFYEAEALRIHGELLRQSQSGDGQEHFARALTLARRQGAHALELRAATSAARAFLADHNTEAARDLLTNACDGFPADVEGPDLNDARGLLEVLRASS